jgi:hypothetical protein
VSVFEISHRATVIGMVTDEHTRQPIGGVEVELQGSGLHTMRAFSRPDGLFAFFDVPEGSYAAAARWPEGLSRYGVAIGDVRVDAGALRKPATVNLALRPTLLRGRIVDPDGQGVPVAFVRLRNGADRCYTNEAGEYVLAGIESGERELLISARGYDATAKLVKLAEAGAQRTLDDISLKKTEVKRGHSRR